MYIDQEQQYRVVAMTEALNQCLSGKNVAEARTALTLAVTCTIIAVCEVSEWENAAQLFYDAVLELIRRPEVTEWIKTNIKSPHSLQ
jgi:hypothetical protein